MSNCYLLLTVNMHIDFQKPECISPFKNQQIYSFSNIYIFPIILLNLWHSNDYIMLEPEDCKYSCKPRLDFKVKIKALLIKLQVEIFEMQFDTINLNFSKFVNFPSFLCVSGLEVHFQKEKCMSRRDFQISFPEYCSKTIKNSIFITWRVF